MSINNSHIRVALYARVSRADKDQEPENQLRKLREYASRHDWDIYAEFHDYVSGAASVKPTLEKMLREGRARHYNAILIVRLDRLARSAKQLLTMLEDLDRFGVTLVCSDQQIDTNNAMGKLLFTVLGAIAELELELISERTKDGLARAKAQGKRLGRPPNPQLDKEIIRLRTEGLSLREIGNRIGLSHQAVKQRLRRAGYKKGSTSVDEAS
ncbi:MAG: recombinase family protein [Methanomassiliicoccales archaeon]|jgi:DNA invertase Pin-like site-specific DNA recombinase